MSGGTSSVFLPPPPPAKCVTFGPAPGAFSPKPPPAPLPLDMVLATRPSFFDLPSASAWDLSALSIISDMARWTTEADTTRLGLCQHKLWQDSWLWRRAKISNASLAAQSLRCRSPGMGLV